MRFLYEKLNQIDRPYILTIWSHIVILVSCFILTLLQEQYVIAYFFIFSAISFFPSIRFFILVVSNIGFWLFSEKLYWKSLIGFSQQRLGMSAVDFSSGVFFRISILLLVFLIFYSTLLIGKKWRLLALHLIATFGIAGLVFFKTAPGYLFGVSLVSIFGLFFWYMCYFVITSNNYGLKKVIFTFFSGFYPFWQYGPVPFGIFFSIDSKAYPGALELLKTQLSGLKLLIFCLLAYSISTSLLSIGNHLSSLNLPLLSQLAIGNSQELSSSPLKNWAALGVSASVFISVYFYKTTVVVAIARLFGFRLENHVRNIFQTRSFLNLLGEFMYHYKNLVRTVYIRPFLAKRSLTFASLFILIFAANFFFHTFRDIYIFIGSDTESLIQSMLARSVYFAGVGLLVSLSWVISRKFRVHSLALIIPFSILYLLLTLYFRSPRLSLSTLVASFF